jgi:hypothetical protein
MPAPAEVFSVAGTLLSTSLAAGASLAHIRKYLGHVSDRMAEHYAKARELHQTGEKPQVA